MPRCISPFCIFNLHQWQGPSGIFLLHWPFTCTCWGSFANDVNSFRYIAVLHNSKITKLEQVVTISVRILLQSKSWGSTSLQDPTYLRGGSQGGRCILPLARQKGDPKVLSSQSKTGAADVAASCRLLSQWGGRTLSSLEMVHDCHLQTWDCSRPGQMAAAYAVFQYQTALLEIYSNQQAHSKIDLAARTVVWWWSRGSLCMETKTDRPPQCEGRKRSLFQKWKDWE